MLRLDEQLRISEYERIYDVVIPKDNLLRKINENIDFSFVNPMMKSQYCERFGRPAKEPEMMFKLLFLKRLYDLSDGILVDNLNYNMAFKYFVGMLPEDKPINSSLLTKFRKTRISENMLEEMLGETIKQAIEKGLINSKSIIVDSTHSSSKGNPETPTQILRRLSKSLRKEIYKNQPELVQYFPEKPAITAEIDEEIEYTKELIRAIEIHIESEIAKKFKDRIIEILEGDKIKSLQSDFDGDAKIGHKTADTSFFGYKNHIAMTEERLITALEVGPGQEADTTKLENLIEKTKENGVEINEVIGDKAYSSKSNIDYCEENGIKLVSGLNPIVRNGRPKDPEFVFNKDANMLQCPEGHLAIRCDTRQGRNGSINCVYWFSVKICKICPRYGTCCKAGASKKSCCVTITSETHRKQHEFEQTDYFKQRIKDRYKIEAKNAELKQVHGLDKCKYVGLCGMRTQMYFTAFVANVKRIIKLNDMKVATQ